MGAAEAEASDLGMEETELKLGLPGVGRSEGEIRKRALTETTTANAAVAVQLRLGSSAEVAHTAGGGAIAGTRATASKSQRSEIVGSFHIVGWPPVRPCRRKLMHTCKFVKVAVDGAPYLRKVDLEGYNSYEQLLTALEEMFSCFTAGNYSNERILVDPVNGTEFVPTYEDRDGDWMLVGDVPWKMFTESCKRLRFVKRSEACSLVPGTPEGSTNAG